MHCLLNAWVDITVDQIEHVIWTFVFLCPQCCLLCWYQGTASSTPSTRCCLVSATHYNRTSRTCRRTPPSQNPSLRPTQFLSPTHRETAIPTLQGAGAAASPSLTRHPAPIDPEETGMNWVRTSLVNVLVACSSGPTIGISRLLRNRASTLFWAKRNFFYRLRLLKYIYSWNNVIFYWSPTYANHNIHLQWLLCKPSADCHKDRSITLDLTVAKLDWQKQDSEVFSSCLYRWQSDNLWYTAEICYFVKCWQLHVWFDGISLHEYHNRPVISICLSACLLCFFCR